MPKAPEFPLKIRAGSVEAKIYRQKAPTNVSGYAFVLSWVGPNGREKQTFADLKVAKDEADLKVSQLANGLVSAAHVSRSDIFELTEARSIAEQHQVPLLTAMAEWAKARELIGPALLAACEEWAAKRNDTLKRIKTTEAVELFIAAKDSAKKAGTRTYTAKLKGVKEQFADFYLDSITVQNWSSFLARFEDAVTRNDIRKRITTLCRWAQRHGHLREDSKPEIEKTERAKEIAHPIGILKPNEFEKLLNYFRKEHPQHLAAMVLLILR